MSGANWASISEATDTSVTGGLKERIRARGAVREMVLALRQIDMAVRRGDFDAAADAYADYRAQVAPTSITLAAAEPFLLFDAGKRRQHFAALARLAELAK